MVVVSVQLKEQQDLYTQNNKITDLYVYFNRPEQIIPLRLDENTQNKSMDQLTYTEFFNLYCWEKKLRSALLKKPQLEGVTWWKVELPNRQTIYITKRIHPDRCIVRMNMVYPSAGELCYLRILLLHVPTRSFEELLNRENGTYQEACLVSGLLHDHNEAIRCFDEAMVFSAPRELRNLFVIQTVQGFPTNAIFEDPLKRKAMSLDYIQRYQQGDGSPMALNDLLTDLATRFQAESK